LALLSLTPAMLSWRTLYGRTTPLLRELGVLVAVLIVVGYITFLLWVLATI
jgi:hypothetical protein